ncbi:hypothetical protein LOK49_LG03G02554 [Camellia lanceoleosa]|uniref:Uncharacterized protein n=1 Tax=Camellia lanceoleosa TaxID=1840588 RepID=A0ACC0ID79_9ERIC|nr:hypothetical protein LOK49_LG03G02554 [Camellia lanceoleosa]
MDDSHSRKEFESIDFEEEPSEKKQPQEQEEENDETYKDVEEGQRSSRRRKPKTPSSMDEVEAKLKTLKLKYPSNIPNIKNAINLYLHIGGNTPTSRWIVFDKIASFSFVKTSQIDSSEGKEDENDEESEDVAFNGWVES